MIVPLTAACIAAAAAAQNVSETALWLILKVEGGRVGACTVQSNESHDCGPAQINAETWVTTLAGITGRTVPEVFYAIRDNGCFNIHAAAYILRQKIDETEGDVWDGMGRYNSATPVIKQRYQSRLVAAYNDLFPERENTRAEKTSD